MQVSYKLHRVCGHVYCNGNLLFTPDGNSLISPIGNRISVFDLIHHTNITYPFENKKNISQIAISNNGLFLLSIDIDGHALLINFTRQIVLTRIHFKKPVYNVKFSPNDKYFIITYGNGCQIWKTPNIKREFSPLILCRTFGSHHDEVTCIDWSNDSNSIIMGSKDLNARIYYRVHSKNMAMTLLTGHRDIIIGCYFNKQGDEAYTIAQSGALFSWKLIIDEEKLLRNIEHEEVEDMEDSEDDSSDEEEKIAIVNERLLKKMKYQEKLEKRSKKWILHDRKFLWEQHSMTEITSTSFNKATGLLVIGFNQGVFGLYEMPSCTNLHRLTISQASVNTCDINSNGSWLALGSSSLGQLLVWEWQSETYVLKQQGHVHGLSSIDYSNDGQHIATGGEDGKLKLWNTSSGFCFITFTDHVAPITCVRFLGQGKGKAILSSSLDGTIRAYDMNRYQNFKILTAPSLVQFTSLSIDSGGEIVCAGSLEPFHIYVWSLQTGQLLDILSGHEGPIACLESCSSNGNIIASGSWDGKLIYSYN